MNLLEGIYEKEKESVQENWILAHKLRTGKLPPVPDCLLPIIDFSTYEKGDPITTNIKVIPMSAQFFNKLSPSEKQNLNQFLEYIGVNPADYEWKMRQSLPPKELPEPIKYIRR